MFLQNKRRLITVFFALNNHNMRKWYFCLTQSLSKHSCLLHEAEVRIPESSFSYCFLLTIACNWQWNILPSFKRIKLQMLQLWLILAFNLLELCFIYFSSSLNYDFVIAIKLRIVLFKYVGKWTGSKLHIYKRSFYRYVLIYLYTYKTIVFCFLPCSAAKNTSLIIENQKLCL